VTAPIAKPAPPALPKARNTADTPVPCISVLFIGPPKSGKSTCALSFPAPLVLDFGSNLAALMGSDNIAYLKGSDLGATSGEIIRSLEQLVIPAIANGRVQEITDQPVKTVVFEDLTYLLGEHLGKVVRGAKDTLSGFEDYGTFLHKAENLILKMTDLVHHGFNVVATCHLAETGGDDIMQKDSNGKWVKVGSKPVERRPAIPGRFREILCARFDAALLTECHLTVVTAKNDKGVVEAQKIPEYFVWSINPDSTYEGIGQGLGREGGKFKPLPPKLDGRYASLAKAWGLAQ
jgi:AAA domain